MDNSSLMNRENKKRQLRRQIVPPMYQNEQESEQAIRNAHKKTVRKRMTIFIIAAVLLGGAAFGIYYYARYHTFYDFQVVWEKNLTEENQEAAISGKKRFHINIQGTSILFIQINITCLGILLYRSYHSFCRYGQ